MVHVYKGIPFSHENEILPFAATWMDLEGFMLSEISQTEKDKYCMVLLTRRLCVLTYTNSQKQRVERWL